MPARHHHGRLRNLSRGRARHVDRYGHHGVCRRPNQAHHQFFLAQNQPAHPPPHAFDTIGANAFMCWMEWQAQLEWRASGSAISFGAHRVLKVHPEIAAPKIGQVLRRQVENAFGVGQELHFHVDRHAFGQQADGPERLDGLSGTTLANHGHRFAVAVMRGKSIGGAYRQGRRGQVDRQILKRTNRGPPVKGDPRRLRARPSCA